MKRLWPAEADPTDLAQLPSQKLDWGSTPVTLQALGAKQA
jgi:hypothetical protein